MKKILAAGAVFFSITLQSTPSFSWWQPEPFTGITWQWQIGSVPAVNELLDVAMYDVDLFDTPKSTIDSMHSKGITVTCYFSAGTYEGWRPDWAEYFDFISGDSYSGSEPPFLGKMADWDERWLDVREIALLEPIMRGRMAMAAEKGCDCVEPDNMDSYTNKGEVNPDGAYNGTHQIAYNKAIAQWAHDENLSVALKNDVDQLGDLVDDFDWALNEQCFQYNECDGYQVFIDAGKAVFGVEYNGDNFCAAAYDAGYSWLKKKLSLNAWVEPCDVQGTPVPVIKDAVQDNRHSPAASLTLSKLYDLKGTRVNSLNTAPGIYIGVNNSRRRAVLLTENRY